MIIEIDDAGTGSPLGGIVIGILKGRLFDYEIIPVEYFQNEENNEYYNEIKEKTLESVLKLLRRVNFDPEEDIIHICRGNIFSHVHKYLWENKLKWTFTKIVSRLQDLVEFIYDLHLVELGVPRMLVKRLTTYGRYVTELFKWVALSPKDRQKIVKTRFPIWRKEWKYSEVSFKETISKRFTYCIECGETIPAGEKVITAIIKTPKREFKAYLHPQCYERLKFKGGEIELVRVNRCNA